MAAALAGRADHRPAADRSAARAIRSGFGIVKPGQVIERDALALALLAVAGLRPAAAGAAPQPLCTGGRLRSSTGWRRCSTRRSRAGAAPGAVLAVSVATARATSMAPDSSALDDPAPARRHTVYDLASLTKVVATTTLAMQAVERGTARARRPGRSATSRLSAAPARSGSRSGTC